MARHDDFYGDHDRYGSRNGGGRHGSASEITHETGAQSIAALTEEVRSGIKSHTNNDEQEGKENPKIFFGLVEVPPSFAHTYNVAYNFFQPRLRLLVEKGIQNYGKNILGKHTGTVADVFGWTYTFGAPIAGGVGAYFTRAREYKDLAKTLSPVLEAMGKKATSGNLNVLAGNEIYQVEQRRIGINTRQHLMTDVVAESVASAQQAVWKLHEPRKEHEEELRPKRGESAAAFIERRRKFNAPKLEREKALSDEKLKEFKELNANDGIKIDEPGFRHWDLDEEQRSKYEENKRLIEQIYSQNSDQTHNAGYDDAMRDLGSAVGAGASEALRWSFLKDAKKNLLKETALDKIVAVCREIDDKGAEAFGVQELTERIQDIGNTHQRNMKQSEVRQVDKENYERAAKQVAEAICNYYVNPMVLVLLFGSHGPDNDRLIIKKQGKQIATFEETQAAIDKVAELMPTSSHIDPHTYDRELAITSKKQKEVLAQLPEGQLRSFYISELPQSVAREYGISDKDYIATKRSMRANQNELLRLAIIDLLVMPDIVLKEVLKDQDIERFRKIGDDVLERGVAAVKETRSKDKPDGVEMYVLAFAPYWNKLVTGELKEIGALGNQLGEKYKEERAAKNKEGEKRGGHEDERDDMRDDHSARSERGDEERSFGSRKERNHGRDRDHDSETTSDKTIKRSLAAESEEDEHEHDSEDTPRDTPRTRVNTLGLKQKLESERSEHASHAVS